MFVVVCLVVEGENVMIVVFCFGDDVEVVCWLVCKGVDFLVVNDVKGVLFVGWEISVILMLVVVL